MKKQVIMIAAALLLGTMSYAQGAGPKAGTPGKPGQAKNGQRGPGGMRGGMGAQKVFDKLGLSAAQKTQLEKINKAHMDKMKAMREKNKGNAKPDMEAMRAQGKKMRDAYMADIKKVLTPAQFKKMETLMAEERAKFMKNRPAGGQKPGGVRKP